MIESHRLIIRFSAFFIVSFLFFLPTKAQPLLPDIHGIYENGMVVLGWKCPYDGLRSIAVERSPDSVHNFRTIGFVENLQSGVQGYVDGHPYPGENWYRLHIVFSSGLTWYSNIRKVVVDSTNLMQQRVLPPNDSLQRIVDKLSLENMPDLSDLDAYSYVRSLYVFTNPFTGHINVELPEKAERRAKYSLIFFNQEGQKILNISQLKEQEIVIDKRNFNRKGIYKFELWKDKEILETGFITIY